MPQQQPSVVHLNGVPLAFASAQPEFHQHRAATRRFPDQRGPLPEPFVHVTAVSKRKWLTAMVGTPSKPAEFSRITVDGRCEWTPMNSAGPTSGAGGVAMQIQGSLDSAGTPRIFRRQKLRRSWFRQL